MKSMKKFSGLIALVCVLLSVLLLTCACTNEQGKDQETTGTGTTQAPTEAPTEVPTQTPTEKPTTETPDDPTPPSDGKVTYTVKIMRPDLGSTEGILVQMCDDAGCKLPQPTDANGEVSFRFVESNYHVTLSNLPEGFVAEAEYYFTDNALRILLKEAK